MVLYISRWLCLYVYGAYPAAPGKKRQEEWAGRVTLIGPEKLQMCGFLSWTKRLKNHQKPIGAKQSGPDQNHSQQGICLMIQARRSPICRWFFQMFRSFWWGLPMSILQSQRVVDWEIGFPQSSKTYLRYWQNRWVNSILIKSMPVINRKSEHPQHLSPSSLFRLQRSHH